MSVLWCEMHFSSRTHILLIHLHYLLHSGQQTWGTLTSSKPSARLPQQLSILLFRKSDIFSKIYQRNDTAGRKEKRRIFHFLSIWKKGKIVCFSCMIIRSKMIRTLRILLPEIFLYDLVGRCDGEKVFAWGEAHACTGNDESAESYVFNLLFHESLFFRIQDLHWVWQT